MKIKLLFIAASLGFVGALAGAEAAPSAASLRELMQVTNARAVLDRMLEQFDTMLGAGMSEPTDGYPLSLEDRGQLQLRRVRMVEIIREELTWEKLEPMYLEVYAEAFSQAEVDGMLAFYRTPAGVALITKMPLVIEKTMRAMQGNLGPLMQKIAEMESGFADEPAAEAAGPELELPAANPNR